MTVLRLKQILLLLLGYGTQCRYEVDKAEWTDPQYWHQN